jgi:ribosome-interacting GTPase 1
MPTNLPPDFYKAEKYFKEATTPEEKAASLEELLKTIPKHKGTDKLRAEYRRKLSKLKSQAQSKKKISRHESHFHIEKEGDGRVVVIGTANVGKSALVGKLTHASPEVSDSPFSTWVPTPGMLIYNGVHLQLLDTPAIDRDYIEPELIDLIKHSNLILLLLDLQAYPIQQFQKSLEVLENHKIYSYHKKSKDADKRDYFVPIVIAVNKDDGESLDEEFDVLNELLKEEGWVLLPVSVKENRNISEMMQFIIREMRIIRVFSKRPHEDADMNQPFILHSDSNVGEFAQKVHKDFLVNLKSAKVWGTGVRDGQTVGKDHLLHDGDVVELHI